MTEMGLRQLTLNGHFPDALNDIKAQIYLYFERGQPVGHCGITSCLAALDMLCNSLLVSKKRNKAVLYVHYIVLISVKPHLLKF